MCQISHETLKGETKILHTELSYQNVQEVEMGQYKKNFKLFFLITAHDIVEMFTLASL